MKITSVEDFYQEITKINEMEVSSLYPDGLEKETGHFNVFHIEDLVKKLKADQTFMPYNRRAYYKISLVVGHNIAEYADKIIPIEKTALLFATPLIPYHWVPQDEDQSGSFCIFTTDFLHTKKTGLSLDDLPIFKPGAVPVFQLSEEEKNEIAAIFAKMHKEISSDYAYKFDLLRNYVLELIHFGQKLQPVEVVNPPHNASARVSSLFNELLERQFPIESPRQQIKLRTARDFAERLSVHVNHLNKVLKEDKGKTTTEIIADRLVQEAKILLRQTNWNISEIADSLGFEEVAHFSNFFKKQTSFSPVSFRK
ncbi:MAG: helix-turn-helix transcriptional regulator [Gemmatimonadaceae bacterium]|nr:helix-turn-helix transcriptional regulator [Chitinophagaceae bacterium]